MQTLKKIFSYVADAQKYIFLNIVIHYSPSRHPIRCKTVNPIVNEHAHRPKTILHKQRRHSAMIIHNLL